MEMNLNPKRLGDDLSLDEYNACQYLLYQMDCWNEPIHLDMESSFQGIYAEYKLDETTTLSNEKKDTYRVEKDLTSSNNKIYVAMSNFKKNIEFLHISPSVKIYYQKPKSVLDGNDELWTPDVTDSFEIKQWSVDEAEPSITLEHPVGNVELEKQFENTTFACSYNPTTNKIEIPLPTDLPKNSIISKTMILNFKFDEEPYIDFRNGKSNSSEEIWIDNLEDFENLVKAAPTNGELVVFRLDSNVELPKPPKTQSVEKLGTYYLNEPIVIKRGQNIEIRGGTNNRTRLNGSISQRCFIVKAGGKLTLKDMICEYCNSVYCDYDAGRGGAILVEGTYSDYGILQCSNCSFVHNKATHGGVIFSYHSALYVNYCNFDTNECYYNGGTIYYMAQDVKMEVSNVVIEQNKTATLKATVKKVYNNYPVNEGKVVFYIKDGKKSILVGESRVNLGIAQIPYEVPSLKQTTEFPIIAQYFGGQSMDNEEAVGTLKVKVPEVYTISWNAKNPKSIKTGETLHMNVQVVDIMGKIVTTPTVYFLMGSTTKKVYGTGNGNMYELVYPITEDDITDKKNSTFEITCGIEQNTEGIKHKSNVIKTTMKVEIEEEKDNSGYVTGLFINGNSGVTDSTVKTKLQEYKKAGITDLFVIYTTHTKEGERNLLERILKARDDNKITGIRIHPRINILNDTTTDTWYDPTNTTRIKAVKETIDYIHKNYKVDGISLDYLRYSGTGGKDNSRHPKITTLTKTITDYIKSKSKTYIISAVCKAEDDYTKTYYGQDLVSMAKNMDYLMPMIYRADYDKGKVVTDDNWVHARLKYILDNGVDKKQVVVLIQTYYKNLNRRNKDELNGTITRISGSEVKGVGLFREGLIATDKDDKNIYPDTYETLLNKSKKK